MKFTLEECYVSQTKPVYILGTAVGPVMTSLWGIGLLYSEFMISRKSPRTSSFSFKSCVITIFPGQDTYNVKKNTTDILNVWVSRLESLYSSSMVYCEHYFTYKFKSSTLEHLSIVLLIFKFHLIFHLFLVCRQFLGILSSIF